MITLETNEKKIILPIWHDVSPQEVIEFNPILGDRVAIRSDMPLDNIILAIEAATWGGQKAREIGDPLRKEYAELESVLADYDANERLSRSEQGVRLVAEEISHLLDVFLQRLDQVKGSMQLQMQRRDRPVLNSPYCPAVLGIRQIPR